MRWCCRRWRARGGRRSWESHDRIILSAKVSGVQDLIAIYADLGGRCDYPLHLGLTEAGMGSKGIVASTAGMSVLLQQGIGDTIRCRSRRSREGIDRIMSRRRSCRRWGYGHFCRWLRRARGAGAPPVRCSRSWLRAFSRISGTRCRSGGGDLRRRGHDGGGHGVRRQWAGGE